MGLDDFKGDTSGVASSSGRGGGGRGRRTTKIDFTTPYLTIVREQDDSVVGKFGSVRVIKPEDELEQDHEVLCRFSDSLDWKRFVKKAKDELGVDAREVLNKDPERNPDLKKALANPQKFDLTRTCQVCGDDMLPGRDEYEELQLGIGGVVSVHSHHTIKQLVGKDE